jgi:16S rRNA processing protein RimM
MEYFKVGKIVNTHGVRGEIKVYPYTDNIENLLSLKMINLKDGIDYKVISSKFHKNMIIYKIKGIDTIEDTTRIMNKYLYIEKKDIVEEDTFYYEDLEGLDVYNIDNNEYIGKLVYVFNTGANDIYEIKLDDKSIYIPAIKDVVKKVDLNEKKMFIKLMEGLQ